MTVLPEHIRQAREHAVLNYIYYDPFGRNPEELQNNILTGKLAEIVFYYNFSDFVLSGPELDCSNRRSDDGYDFKIANPLTGRCHGWNYREQLHTGEQWDVMSDMLDLKCCIKQDGGNGFRTVKFPSTERRNKLRATGKWDSMSPFYLVVDYDTVLMEMEIIGYMHESEIILMDDGGLVELDDKGRLHIKCHRFKEKMEDAVLASKNYLLED